MDKENEKYLSPYVEETENVGLGIIGALIGSIIGGLSIILLYKIGIIASVSGVIMSVCTLKYYEKLAHKRSTIGTLICILIMIGAVLASYNAVLAWEIVDEIKAGGYSISFTKVFINMFDIVKKYDITSEYLSDLGMIYLFVILGAVSMIRRKNNPKKVEYKDTIEGANTELSENNNQSIKEANNEISLDKDKQTISAANKEINGK